MVISVDWQQVLSLCIVALAAGALLWGRVRRRKFSFQRDTHCGCSTDHAPTRSAVIFHARKGARPQVVVKMK